MEMVSFAVFELADLTRNILSAGPQTLIWPATIVILALFAVHGLILLYHWLVYGKEYPLVWAVMLIHAGVSFILIGTLLTSAAIIA